MKIVILTLMVAFQVNFVMLCPLHPTSNFPSESSDSRARKSKRVTKKLVYILIKVLMIYMTRFVQLYLKRVLIYVYAVSSSLGAHKFNIIKLLLSMILEPLQIGVLVDPLRNLFFAVLLSPVQKG